MKRFYTVFSICSVAMFACGCSESSNGSGGTDNPGGQDGPDITEPCTGQCCDPKCTESEVCYNNTCIVLSEHPDICIPQCKGKKVCTNNKCVNIDEHPEICIPKCGENQTCVQNHCVETSAACTPACNENQVCENGQCRDKDPNACTGKLCKSSSVFCNDSGAWEDCPSGTGCHLGYCLKGLGKECEDNTCSDDLSRVCKDGVWINCYEPAKCSNSGSTAECVIQDDNCSAGSCSDNHKYQCSSEGHWNACDPQFECSAGECKATIDQEAAMLWTLCQADSECSNGKCLKSIVTSRPLTKSSMGIAEPSDNIPVSILDTRIPDGYGVCSANCTQNPDVCGQMDSNLVQFTCQVVITGDSPYPPLDEYHQPYELPFEHRINKSDMEIAPFGAICRPNDKLKLSYSDKLCHSCDSSEQCGEGENCVYNMCLPKCASTAMCPLSFECKQYKDTDESFCMPPEGICGSCLDRDGDGQGFGHCSRKGYDCDDTNPDVSYTKQLPAKCSNVVEDSNCNGMADQYEFLGTLDHCGACGDSCHPVDNANIVRKCQMINPDVPIDKSSMQGLRDTFRFTCHEECAVEYADCDQDPTNGCETRLVEFSENYTSVKSLYSGKINALDYDGDGYGEPDTMYHSYCCPKNKNDVAMCYRLPNINDIPKDGTAFNWIETPELEMTPEVEKIITTITPETIDKLSDCNDENAKVHPHAKEMCDGLDNDCDSSSQDGIDDQYVLNYLDNTSLTKNFGENCTLYKNQPENADAPHCGTGKVACALTGTTEFKMSCVASGGEGKSELDRCNDEWAALSDTNKAAKCANICDFSKDECKAKCKEAVLEECLCNGIDDNCDGHIDEDWQFKKCTLEDKVGICQMGILTCGKSDGNPAAVCMPLFPNADGRGYDFYGDGIDSNCDGEDFDLSSTLFVTPYFGSGSFEPAKTSTGEQKNVPGLGLYYAPYVSLKKALSVACSKTVDGVKCRDILVNSAKGADIYKDWQTEDIKIPVYNSSDVYRPDFLPHERKLADNSVVNVNTWTHDEIVSEFAEYWKEVLNSSSSDYEEFMLSADTSKILLEGEIYPRELVRIIGGMRMTEIEENGQKVPKWTKSSMPTEYNVSITYGKDNALYSYNNSRNPLHILIQPDSSMSQIDSMSLYLDSFRFNMTGELKAGNSMKEITNALAYRGVTFIGLSCGGNGCRDLTFHNTEFNITAPKGISADIKHNENAENGWSSDGLTDMMSAGNDIWNANVKKGYDGSYWTLDSATAHEWNVSQFVASYNAGICLRPNHKSEDVGWMEGYSHWGEYYDSSNAKFKGYCPDGVLPFGGCGGGICTKDNCQGLGNGATFAAGQSGKGATGGTGGSGYANKGDNCDEGFWCGSEYDGKKGSNGAAGTGGKVLNSFLSMKMTQIVPPASTPSKHIYFDSNPQLGHGTHGQTGGGGGGGGICRGFTRTGVFYNSRFFYAPGGGAGGCGGWQGHAGGTGGSAVGMFITPPARTNESLVITPDTPKANNRFVFVTAGQGGDGQDGQLGIVGAAAGNRKGYYDAGHCEVAGNAGSGGTGGSSGGGAAGSPGASYAFIFACNRDGYSESKHPFAVKDSTSRPDTPNCGISFEGSLGMSETESSYGKVTPIAFGADGGDAKPVNGSNPGAYGAKGTNNQPRSTILYNNIEYRPMSAVYNTIYLTK